MTGIEHDICDTQGRIYEYASTFGYDMEVFSKAYLCSDFCHRAMDAPYSRFQLHTEEECWDFIYPEIEKVLKKYPDGQVFDRNVAYWIGFTYRHAAFITEASSRELNEGISFKTMCNYYPGMHTIDEDAAIDIIKGNIFAI